MGTKRIRTRHYRRKRKYLQLKQERIALQHEIAKNGKQILKIKKLHTMRKIILAWQLAARYTKYNKIHIIYAIKPIMHIGKNIAITETRYTNTATTSKYMTTGP